ncbi:MAG: L-2-amino-thiazoline-4-carboxylic acid hydrolase [Candidatus Odinarchaeota archaeon]
MIEDGILKGASRKEKNWKKIKFGEPFKKALDRFRESVQTRKDFDPSSLLQFGLFMSMAVINVLKENEARFGIEGQKAVNDALIKTGYQIGREIGENVEIPADISDIELMSFLATIVNTQAWTSIEDPKIDDEDTCSFNILWCPLQDIYSAFDCRVQRYLVQGIINYFRDHILKSEFQIEFKNTIPAGATHCRFIIERKKKGEQDKWETYSKLLERKALKRFKKKKKNNE